ncbi:MAG: pyruvate, phosphate dikinase [Ruminococcaceae bacterium]|nr:pyruvate, phosphate dikinase [Oscillospiraceae bacterium]
MERYKNVAKDDLVERAKELECLYLIDEALAGTPFPDVTRQIAEIIPVGFRSLSSCIVSIRLDGETYSTKPDVQGADTLQTPIMVNGAERGYIKVAYPKNTFSEDSPVFLEQEKKLLHTIAARVAEQVTSRTDRETDRYQNKWKTIIDLLQKTDHESLLYVCGRMVNMLCRANPQLLTAVYQEMGWAHLAYQCEMNAPLDRLPDMDVIRLSERLFSSAATFLDDKKIYENINLWIYQGKTYDIARIVNRKDSDIKSIIKALKKYVQTVKANEGSSEATNRWLKAELIRRFLTENPASITNAQKHVKIEAFCELLESYIASPRGIGKIGGKGSGLFIARQILEAQKDAHPQLGSIKCPRTWYISAEEMYNLIDNNGLDELHEHKYKDLTEIRATYPGIIQRLKNLSFSTFVDDALSEILDACPDKPLIVRSSSLLEDQIDTSFAGKYKSLFIPNTGTKAERHRQLVEGILEVYASVYNPDSIQYRKKHNLLDYAEQMGILIQEVVGKKVGPYYFPLVAGLAFSSNELRWSPRIRRESGLMRLVMGLGTRAVDRIGDDYPVLISPGQPGLRVNQTPQDVRKYAPRKIDVLDLENKCFSTLPIIEMLKAYGDKIDHIDQVVSVYQQDMIRDTNRFTADFTHDEFVVTFAGLMQKTHVNAQIKAMLSVLQEHLGYPVDVEFASDGESLYLLQCRPQSRGRDNAPPPIPADIPHNNILFTAKKYITNGQVSGIKTVVYIDPAAYAGMAVHEDYLRVGRVVSELNTRLPRRSFILMGPGRWGSRGDIKLGVPVTYADINNTAMLIEIATSTANYQPELSFGTHFFQDLVEENIKYLPLYPDETQVLFNQSFFSSTSNRLAEMLPEYADLAPVIKLIQVDKEYQDQEVCVLMNGDLEKAMAFLTRPRENAEQATTP